MGKRGGGGGSGREGGAPAKQQINKGKFKKFSRSHNYVTSEEDMERRDRFEDWKQRKKGGDDDDVAEGESGEEEEGSSEEEGGEGKGGERGPEEGAGGMAEAFKKKVQVRDLPPAESGSEEEEYNGPSKGGQQEREGGEGMTRKEREEAAREKAREEYLRRYREGETEEAKKDLARLAEVRARREQAARKKEEEVKAREALNERLRLGAEAAEAGAGEGGKTIEALDPREVKKMSGTKLKECLKERGLSTQGQKKELVDRLVAYGKK
ncbi:hypothetical protein NSK_008516 [Nannochloropsis salina CCMP1776]|uniref:SAP domain-containing protein n=1 Tax=Nannochloropsis salina CCMP1776 TaxID=1027361 RepID=A0A4D9CTC2_9STRA|nr:hypothetical protein NSK_008516 [Nannochloropsis salina CCMP1776]|eukprot:TFJ79958.1 hypothetical protein NSK_008516 [Nannochloropsis salina CCMP1776]